MTTSMWVLLVGVLAAVVWFVARGRGRQSGIDPAGDALETRAFDSDGDEAVPTEGSITPEALLERIDRGERVHILDVRFEGEYAVGRVPGAVNIPFMQVSSRIASVPGTPADELIVYCGHGPRAYIAASTLRRAGRSRITFVEGHWAGWQAAGLRVEQ